MGWLFNWLPVFANENRALTFVVGCFVMAVTCAMLSFMAKKYAMDDFSNFLRGISSFIFIMLLVFLVLGGLKVIAQ